MQVKTETCTAISQAVICFVIEKRILFPKTISWAPLQAKKVTKIKQLIHPNLLTKGTDEVDQNPSSSAVVSFGPGMGNLDLDL